MSIRSLYSICHTTARPAEWRKSYYAWVGRAGRSADTEYVLCVDSRWGFEPGMLDSWIAERPGLNTLVWNEGRRCMVDGYRAAAQAATGRVLILNSDDMFPPEGWDTTLAEVMGEHDPDADDFAIHVSTGYYDGPRSSSIQILSRARYSRLGYAMYPEYESVFADDDFLEAAYADGVAINARHLMFPHQHPQGAPDEVYRHQNRRESYKLGEFLIGRRRADHFGSAVIARPRPLCGGRVILFCPVRQDPDTLALALASHRELEGVVERWYFDDNDDPASTALLKSDARAKLITLDVGPKTEYAKSTTHQWSPHLMSRMADIRDRAIAKFLETDADALLIIDSDLIAHRQSVEHLYGLGVLVASEVFWSRWQPSDPWLPNVWDFHDYGFTDPSRITRLRDSGLYEVGGLGAMTLLRRHAMQAGAARYRMLPGIPYPGEDRHFSIRCASYGVPLYADTAYPPFHVYRPEQLDEARAWFEMGCDPGYFRTHWLIGEWESAVRKSTEITAATSGPAGASTSSRPVIAIALPGERFASAWVSHAVGLITQLQGSGYIVGTHYAYSSNVYVTRGVLLESIMSSTPAADLVLWLDDDNILTFDQLTKLARDLHDHPEADGVAAWCWIQPDAYAIAPMVSCGHLDAQGECHSLRPEILATGSTSLIEVGYTGFPAFLMRASSLSKLTAAYPQPFNPILNPAHRYGFSGEDVAFCIRARQAGLRFFVDPGVQVPHLKLRAVEPIWRPGTPGVVQIEAEEVIA